MSNRKPARGTRSDVCGREASRSKASAASAAPVAPVALALACIAALLAGIVSTWLASAAGVENGDDALCITEVMSSNGSALRLPDGTLPDWVEIENISDEAVDLTGWALLTEARPNKAFTFPGGALGPGARAVVYCDGSVRALIDGEYHAPFRLSAAGETIALINPRGRGVDAVAVPALSKDEVYCVDARGEWIVSDFATPGGENREAAEQSEDEVGTVKVVPGAVEITEVMSRNNSYLPDGSGDHPDYIEIHNTTNTPVSLAGWSLSDNVEKLRRYTFPDVTLPADGYLVVRCTGVEDKEGLCAGFRLFREGEEIYLTDPDGVTTACVRMPELAADQAYSLTDAGWSDAEAPTPGHVNDRAGAEAAAAEAVRENPYGIYITEVMASSSQTGDWIEIYNAGAQILDLGGCGLSDNSGKPRKWQFPAGTNIQPGQYLIVHADGAQSAGDGQLHADYRLSAEGGYAVTLCDPQGKVFDWLFVPQQYRDIAYGRMSDMTGLRYFLTPTPGSANAGQSCYGRAPQPKYTTDGGLFKTGETVTVGMTVPEGCSVYYTLDCTDPTQSSTRYAGPIAITGTTILRTRVYCEGYLESFMDSQSYLFDVNNGDGTVYVASLVSDPANLFGEEAGIMAMGPNAEAEPPYGSKGKGANFWMNWEREAHIEVFHPDGHNLISQECGVRLHGNSSRSMDQKAFKILARSAYGSNRFKAALFSRRPYTEYQSFLLRTGAQDIKKTHMRDEILQSLAANLHLMYQEYEAAVVYINGEFWGHYSLRELVNAVSICQFEGWEGDEDKIDIVNKDRVIEQGSADSLNKLLEWLTRNDPNTDEAWQAMKSVVDIENYLQYIALEMYIGNYDSQNIKCYRNASADGRWRWILYDLDCGFDIDTNSVRRWLDPAGMGRNHDTDNRLFVALMKSDRGRDMFLTFLGQEMATTYSPENILKMIEAYRALVAPILPDQLARWGMSQAEYEQEVQKLIDYAKSRPMRMLQFLKGAENLRLTREEMERYFGAVMAQQGVTYDDIKAE